MVRLDPMHLLRRPRGSIEVTGISPRTNNDPPVQLLQSLRFALRGAQPFDSGLAALGLRSWQAIRRAFAALQLARSAGSGPRACRGAFGTHSSECEDGQRPVGSPGRSRVPNLALKPALQESILPPEKAPGFLAAIRGRPSMVWRQNIRHPQPPAFHENLEQYPEKHLLARCRYRGRHSAAGRQG